MIREARSIAAEGDALDLDPFGFWPDIASRLVGFGGAGTAEIPDYAFHTRYVVCETGSIVFTVHFANLRAPRGTLILRVHELPEIMGAQARQIAISQAQLVEVVRQGGTVTLPATARKGNSYALIGFIHGDTVATADAVTIEVARRTPDLHDPHQPTRYRADTARVAKAPQIISEHEGTLVAPVSQLCTMRQVKEPIFDAVLQQLGTMAGQTTIDRWEQVFIARALDRYDVARSGARGLGVGGLEGPIAGWLRTHGCELALTAPGETPASDAPPASGQAATPAPVASANAAGFDFAWASRTGGVGGHDRQDVLRFIEDCLRSLKPGGLLVLVVPIDVAPRAIGDETGPVLRRGDIDRIALLLLSRGHQVAQICPWGDAVAEADDCDTIMVSAFGLIIRKAA